MVVFIFKFFGGTSIQYSIFVIPFYIPTNFSALSSAFIAGRVFDYGHSDQLEKKTHFSFEFHSSDN